MSSSSEEDDPDVVNVTKKYKRWKDDDAIMVCII